MLPFRLGIFVGVAALCLWGLFSLLDSLKEPGLLRTAKAVVVKGCDSLDSEEAREMCPGLFCQKAVLDAKLVPLQAMLRIQVDTRTEEGQHFLAGIASTDGAPSHFICELTGARVTQARRIDQETFDTLTASQ